jgi:hypothetical protein
MRVVDAHFTAEILETEVVVKQRRSHLVALRAETSASMSRFMGGPLAELTQSK